MKKYLNILIVTSASLFVTSCGSEDKKAIANTTPAISVKVANVTEQQNSSYLSVSGKTQAVNSTSLSTRMMGSVDKVHVAIGDKVKKGQLLVSINNADLEAKKAQVNARITQAAVAFKNAEKNYKRFQNLFKTSSVSQKEMDDMTVNYQMAKAALEAANQQKNEVNAQFVYSDITAPFSGIITSKNIENGDMASPGMPLISVENPTDFEVVAMVPETEIAQIKNGAQVRVLVKSINATVPGKVVEVSTSAKYTGGQYLVKIELDKKPANMLSGMFATVQFPMQKILKATMVLVPESAIVTNGQLAGIYTVSESKTAILRWLRLGRTYRDQVEVLSGLSLGESYILFAKGKLFNGAKITIQ